MIAAIHARISASRTRIQKILNKQPTVNHLLSKWSDGAAKLQLGFGGKYESDWEQAKRELHQQ